MNTKIYFLFYINFQFFQKSFAKYHGNEFSFPYNVSKTDEVNPIYTPSIDIEEHLIRRRRYLEFPEGSSFQLVYDLVVGVVDYTNYLILGVTVALAWELPTKPPSEILEDLKQRVETGSLNLKRNDFVQPQSYEKNKKTYYKSFKINPLLRKKSDYIYYHATGDNSKYSPSYVSSRSKSGKQQATISKYIRKPITSKDRFIPMAHRILPVFGKKNNALHSRHKRSGINSSILSKWDRIHIRYQRSSRHSLYESIEKYIQGRGSNGHHCVLRALCETGQKSHEQEPGSFVGEIMRAIFTLPEPLEEDILQKRLSYKERRYVIANNLQGDCSQRYHLCKESIWSSHWVM